MQKEIADLLNFFDLTWEENIENYQATGLKRGKIDTPSYSQVVQPLYKDSSYHWKNYKKYLSKYFTTIGSWAEEFGYDLLD